MPYLNRAESDSPFHPYSWIIDRRRLRHRILPRSWFCNRSCIGLSHTSAPLFFARIKCTVRSGFSGFIHEAEVSKQSHARVGSSPFISDCCTSLDYWRRVSKNTLKYTTCSNYLKHHSIRYKFGHVLDSVVALRIKCLYFVVMEASALLGGLASVLTVRSRMLDNSRKHFLDLPLQDPIVMVLRCTQ